MPALVARELTLFEAFYRGGNLMARHTDGAGTWTGDLEGVVEVHGGRIWLDPAPAGTSVHFSLPS
jgi:signal transduction histidine kinase